MGVLVPLNPEMQRLADEHRQWLSAFHPQYLANWENIFNTDDESAMTEAAVRRLLQRHGVVVEPNEELTGAEQRPDFRCVQGTSSFYVEVTRISIEKATSETGIDRNQKAGFSLFQPLNDSIFEACRGKAKQCSGAGGPVLLAIGTWHGFAAMASFDKPLVAMLLTGETKIAWTIDMATGRQVGETYQTTELYSAAFLRPVPTEEVGFARSSISGLLLVANGMEGRATLGVLHPNPTAEFDTALLPGIEFGRVEIDRDTRLLHVHWPQGSN